jgi:flagellar protein FliO/FliZ
MKYLWQLGISIGLLPTLVAAAPAQPESASRLATGGIGTSSALEMAAVLTGVILLILVLGWLVKRVGNFPSAGKGMVKILGGVSLGPRERAVVLEAGEKRILVGVAPGRVQTLCLLDGSEGNSVEKFSTALDVQLQGEEK